MYIRDGVEYASYGAYLRSKNLKIEGCRAAVGGSDRTTQKRWDAELNAYASARAQGIQPAGTRMHQVRAAVDASNEAGKAYDAGTGTFSDTGV